MIQLPASLFILKLLFLKIFEACSRSSNALWTESFYQAIKVNIVCFKDMSTIVNVTWVTDGGMLYRIVENELYS